MPKKETCQLDEIRANFKKTGELFVDKEFQAIESSLYYEETPPAKFEWKRPKVCLFPSNVEFQSLGWDLIAFRTSLPTHNCSMLEPIEGILSRVTSATAGCWLLSLVSPWDPIFSSRSFLKIRDSILTNTAAPSISTSGEQVLFHFSLFDCFNNWWYINQSFILFCGVLNCVWNERDEVFEDIVFLPRLILDKSGTLRIISCLL